MTESKICTCPSGDGSLVHPCPAHPAVEQAGANVGHGHVLPRADGVKMRCGGPGLCSECTADASRARAALAQPSPAQTQPSPAPTLRAAIDVANDRFEVPVAKWGTDLVGEEERPEVAEVAFVLRNIGAMDAEDIDGDNVDLRFEDAEGRDTGCDVSIVEYAEKAADLFEQHDRIVGELRAEIAQLRQHKNDYMDAGQETYRALQNEIREREAEIARLDGLVSSRTTERDAALARVAELKTMSHNYCALLMDANAKLAELEKQEPINLQHMAVAADGELRWMTGRKIDNCELYAMPDFGQAPKLYAAPVAQAQHSVPIAPELKRALGLVVAALEADGDRPTSKYALSELKKVLAAAPGKEVPQAWLDVQAER
ncbi:hypothetical protein AAA619_30850, partial [Pseudomonas aeruginosa]